MVRNKNKSGSFRKRPPFQPDRRGGFKRSKRSNSAFEQNAPIPSGSEETIYRLLCPIRKIGSVIGKGGGIIKALRDETGAKIKVDEAVPGSDERVINIFSPAAKKPRMQDTTEDAEDPENDDPIEKELETMEPHCSAQDALLKVQKRINEDDDLYGGKEEHEDNNEEDVVTARLLVPSNQVGCLLGKGGHIIQNLRSNTGANIRILPAENLPTCAMATDELVQISGVTAVAMRALYDISTMLHENPRPPMDYPMAAGGPDFYPRGPPMLPQGNRGWSHRPGDVPPPMPWDRGFGNEPSRYGRGGFNGAPPANNGKTSDEFSMKILCSAEKIGGVIGKGGSNVNQLQQETGASIHVADTAQEADERVIIVSSYEAPWDPRSQTIEAILLLQSKTNEIGEKGNLVTRLLVPSSKVGCLLGQGGHIINEMRRRTRADIRIISKEGKPPCASNDEELVQIAGNVNVARDALAEIASRLRARSLEGVSAAAEPLPPRPFRGYGPPESFYERGVPPSGMRGAGSSSAYDMQGGVPEYEPPSYPVRPPPATPGYQTIDHCMEITIPNGAVGPVLAAGGSNIANIGQMSGAKVKLNNPTNGSECTVEIRGSSEQMNAAQSLLQAYISSVVNNFNSHQQQPPQQAPYQQAPAPYQHAPAPYQQTPQQAPYQQGAYQQAPQETPYGQGAEQALYEQGAQQTPYDYGSQQPHYEHATQQATYQQVSQQASYQQAPYQQGLQQSPLQGSEQGLAQQGVQEGSLYQPVAEQQGLYQQAPYQY